MCQALPAGYQGRTRNDSLRENNLLAPERYSRPIAQCAASIPASIGGLGKAARRRTDRMARTKLPGNRVIRRRLNATDIISLPTPPKPRNIPTPQSRARQFVAIFLGVLTLGTLILMLPISTESGEGAGLVNALFTAVSALAVTGLVVVDTQHHWNFIGELVILILIQLGGLGFTVGASLLLLSLGRGGRLRTALLAQDGAPTLSLSDALSVAKRIVRFVFVTEALGALLLTARFWQDEPPLIAVWYGIFHAVSAFCNAGFDLQGDYVSMIGYQGSWWVNLTLIALIQAGALSYIAISDVWSKRAWRPLALDTKLVLVTNAILLAIGMLAFLVVEWNTSMAGVTTSDKPLIALFQSVAARTAGFASVNLGDAHDGTLFLWVGLMMIGGASGSTAGGVKLATVAIVVVAIMSTLRGHRATHIANRRIPASQVFLAIGVITVFVLAHFMFTFALTFTESIFGSQDIPFVAVMFETMSGAATVGLSTGITPSLTEPGKLILCLTMFFGRLGPLTLVYAITRRRRPVRYRLPESHIRIG
jgi:trk system potassium uptake protein TrkH